MTNDRKRFVRDAYPTTDAEFEDLMRSIDDELATRGVPPEGRQMRVGLLLWEAFQWSGRLFPDERLAHREGFDGDVLYAKALHWYEVVYGSQLLTHFALGHIPARLGNAVWLTRVPVFYGEVEFFVDRVLTNRRSAEAVNGPNASLNVLSQVEALPQGMSDRLTDHELALFWELFQSALKALLWRNDLPRTELFSAARHDYDASTSDLVARRFGQAKWGAQQACEKTLKGLLELAGAEFPKGGSKGHDLLALGALLRQACGVHVPEGLLGLASCSADVRYGKRPASEQESLLSNHAALGLLELLSSSPQVSAVLRTKR